ncbi:FlgB family protein [Rubellimicrobium sp. CFH 75288]|uniref:FlgB family protein n=1 Tax=Rubellimicrobium sp. CFH 75288 TaxID=2697034 RepID=UPI0014129C7D|nr:FlgB family protein [Rubellimicrobium sp. CFH 75288]
MFESLQIFQHSAALMRHAAARQATAARNIAHADTPGYRALSMPAFSDMPGSTALRATRPGHLAGGAASSLRPRDAGGEAAPNGNTVSLEAEMFASVQATREHNQALAVWRHATGVLRAALGR